MRDDALHLSLYVVIESGGNVPVVGAEVQRRVADAIDRMLALRVEEVNIFVSEVAVAGVLPCQPRDVDGAVVSSRFACSSRSKEPRRIPTSRCATRARTFAPR